MSDTPLGDIPGQHEYQIHVPAHAAATATEIAANFTVPFRGRLVSTEFVPNVATTGDTTNRTNFNVLDGGTAGTGTTEIGNLDLITSTDLAIGVGVNIPITGAPLAVVRGQVLKLQQEKVASGVAVGSGTWHIVIDGVN